jgi:hypothetical protein
VTESGAARATMLPEYGAQSLSDVMPSVLTGLGAPGPDPLGLAAGPLEGVRVTVVLLIDGLGWNLVPLAAPVAPVLARLAAGDRPGIVARPITAGFPSTTPTSLVSLGTGAPPGAHGLVGFSLRVPGTNRVLNHLDWRDDPDPVTWQPLPTMFERAASAGVSGHVVSRPEFAGSGLTTAAYRGGAYVGASDPDELAERVVSLAKSATGPTLIYGYHPDVDKTGHQYGVASPEWRVAVTVVDRLLERVVDGLPPGSALVVTADHGQVDVPAGHRFDIAADERLSRGVHVVAGEARVRYLHTAPGATADVVATWRGVLGPAAWVVERDEAVAAGWFGPVGAAHLQRVGDVVVACHADYVVLSSGTESPRTTSMIAYHGSATPAEMQIPLVVVRP